MSSKKINKDNDSFPELKKYTSLKDPRIHYQTLREYRVNSLSPKKTVDIVSVEKHNSDPHEEENIHNTELRILRDAHKVILDREERSRTNPRIKLKSFIDYTHVIQLINDRNDPVLAKIPKLSKEHDDFAN